MLTGAMAAVTSNLGAFITSGALLLPVPEAKTWWEGTLSGRRQLQWQVFAPASQSFELLLGLEEGFGKSHGSEACGCVHINGLHALRATSAPHPTSRVSHIGSSIASHLCPTAAPGSFLTDTVEGGATNNCEDLTAPASVQFLPTPFFLLPFLVSMQVLVLIFSNLSNQPSCKQALSSICIFLGSQS